MLTNRKSIAKTAALLLMGILSLGAFCPTVHSQDMVWSSSFGGTYSEEGYACQRTDDGGYVVLGSTYSYGEGSFDLYLLRLDSEGDTLWTKTFGGTGTDYGYDIRQTFDGGFVIVGSTSSSGAGKRDVYVLKTDASGNLTWSNTFGGSENDEGRSIRQTSDSGYVVCGTTDSFGPGYSDVYLLRLQKNGNMLWARAYGGAGGDRGYAARLTPDNGIIMVGSTGSFGEGYSSLYAIKTDLNGDVLWSNTYGGQKADFGHSVEVALDGGYIFAGSSGSFSASYADAYLVKVDSDGLLQWENNYGGGFDEKAYSVCVTADGGYALAGITETFGAGGIDIYVVKTDPLGEQLWSSTYGGPESDYSQSIITGSQNDFCLVGYTYSYSQGGSDVYIVNILGDIPTPVYDPWDRDLMPVTAELDQNYPNPFNNSTVISYTVPARTTASITIYNLLGRVVKSWNLGEVPAGTFSVEWNGLSESGEEVATGVYLYRLETSGYNQTRKMVLLK